MYTAFGPAVTLGVGLGVGSDVRTCNRFGSGRHACTGVGQQGAYSDTTGSGTTGATLRTGLRHKNTLCEPTAAGETDHTFGTDVGQQSEYADTTQQVQRLAGNSEAE